MTHKIALAEAQRAHRPYTYLWWFKDGRSWQNGSAIKAYRTFFAWLVPE